MILTYPSKNFASKALGAIRNGTPVQIHVNRGWRFRILEKEVMHWPKSRGEIDLAGGSLIKLPSIKCRIMLLKFCMVYDFAFGGGYGMNCEIHDCIILVNLIPGAR